MACLKDFVAEAKPLIAKDDNQIIVHPNHLFHNVVKKKKQYK